MLNDVIDVDSLRDIFRFFFFNDPATTEIYTLSLHDALPISCRVHVEGPVGLDSDPHLSRGSKGRNVGTEQTEQTKKHRDLRVTLRCPTYHHAAGSRSEEHTSELQSLAYLVCRLLLEKKKKIT